MKTTLRASCPLTVRHRRLAVVVAALFVGSLASLSAHVVQSLINPTLATAFVSSPSAGQDAPIPITWVTQVNGQPSVVDTGLRVVCFYAANTSAPGVIDPDWPRITGVGFELPGQRSGFSLLEPADDHWELVENASVAVPDHGKVTLDFALVTRVNPVSRFHNTRREPAGIPPGQEGVRRSGTRFCVSGPFPDTLPDVTDPSKTIPTTIEQIISGVVVGFRRVEPHDPSFDIGVWIPQPQVQPPIPRMIPLYAK